MGEGGKGPGQGRKGAVRAPPKERFNKTAAILGLGANSAGHRAGRRTCPVQSPGVAAAADIHHGSCHCDADGDKAWHPRRKRRP